MTTTIRKHIEINAPLDKVWRVYTDAEITRQMGGEYATGWKVGDTFSWKGTDRKFMPAAIYWKLPRPNC